jgi:hypothetical protein
VLFWHSFFIFCPVTENEAKEHAVSRLALRVAVAAGARGNSPAYLRAQTVRALISVRIADARHGTKGNKKPYIQESFLSPFKGASL